MSGQDTNEMWGGRFAKGPAQVMQEINASIDTDKRLYREDIKGSLAHTDMLVAQEIITPQEGADITQGLLKIQSEIEVGSFVFKKELEDIHMNIEHRLLELIGPVAGRLHTARSRNDQVATDFRLWVRQGINDIDKSLQEVQKALIEKAIKTADWVMPGMTHLQVAQPVTFGHHLLAYVEMIGRDRGRLQDCQSRLNESPLGACALAGTSFPIDRHMTARALGFKQPMANSMDSVSARDFALEFLASLSICALHFSRLGEEIVIWASAQFGFIRLSDAFSTGSSIMPQKRNPDAAELVRAKAGQIIGPLNQLFIVMKGLPLAYSKDMQEDKRPVFEGYDTMMLIANVTSAMVQDMAPQKEKMQQALDFGFSTATDLADWLVRVGGVTFRQAHHVTGKIVAYAERCQKDISKLTLAQMQNIEPLITGDVFTVLSVQKSVESRKSYGGTAPKNVLEMAQIAEKKYL